MPKKEKINKIIILLIGILLVIAGLFLVTYKHYSNYQIKLQEDKEIELFFEAEQSNVDSDSYEVKNNVDKPKSEYIAVIEIPKISLKRGLVDKNSPQNNVNQNVQILKESDLPTKANGNVILASHSGNSRTAYFKQLKELECGDLVYLYYDQHIFIYKVSNKYEIEKNGNAIIRTNMNKKTLTMITCANQLNNQLVVVAEFVEMEDY